MSAQVKKYYTKTNDQDWSGVYHNLSPKREPRDVSLARKSNPDPRDGNPLTPEEEQLLIAEFDSKLYSRHKNINFEREYVGENLLVVTANFPTDEEANLYVYGTGSTANNETTTSEVKKIFEYKREAGLIPTYNIRYELCYSNGHVRGIRRDIAVNLF
jgi:hypothetical protein